MHVLLVLGCIEPDGSILAEAKEGSPNFHLQTHQGTLTPDLALESAAGIVGVGNFDDDNGDGAWDFGTPHGEEDNDLVPIIVPLSANLELNGTGGLVFTLSGDLDSMRIWVDGEVFLGRDERGVAISSATLPIQNQDTTLWLEFGAVLAQGSLTVTHPTWGTSIETPVTSAPMVMNHHLQPIERIWAMPTGTNGQMIATYEHVFGERFEAVSSWSYGQDIWLQDEFEMASLTAPFQRLDVVWDIVRDRGLANMPGDMIADSQTVLGRWGNPYDATSLDYGGNLEATPPLPGYPLGRIYFGADQGQGPLDVFQDMLQSQQVQAPFAVDSSWLCVGHVDEFSTTIPDPDSRLGWKLVFADTTLGWELLSSMDPDTDLPLYAQTKGYSTVGQMQEDRALLDLNRQVQLDELDPALRVFMGELDLNDDDIIRLPMLFEEPAGCGGTVAALFPGTANLVVAPEEEGVTKLFIPDPFMRADLTDLDADPFVQHILESFPDNTERYFIDDFETYHLYLGEVHCGTNVQRTPTSNWWDAVDSLF